MTGLFVYYFCLQNTHFYFITEKKYIIFLTININLDLILKMKVLAKTDCPKIIMIMCTFNENIHILFMFL